MLNAGEIRGLEMAWNVRSAHIIYRYLKQNEPSHVWLTNIITTRNQSRVGQSRQFNVLFPCSYFHGYKQLCTFTIPCVRNNMSDHTHRKFKVIGVNKNMTKNARSS